MPTTFFTNIDLYFFNVLLFTFTCTVFTFDPLSEFFTVFFVSFFVFRMIFVTLEPLKAYAAILDMFLLIVTDLIFLPKTGLQEESD